MSDFKRNRLCDVVIIRMHALAESSLWTSVVLPCFYDQAIAESPKMPRIELSKTQLVKP